MNTSTHKICERCGESKPNNKEYFLPIKGGWFRGECKACNSYYQRKYREKDKDKWRVYNRAAKEIQLLKETPEHKEQRLEKAKYNPITSKRHYDSKKNDLRYRLNSSISSGVRRSIKAGKGGLGWETVVGYSLGDLISHLERQFTKEMTWENYGTFWEIDHIIPLDYFDFVDMFDSDVRFAWSLTNLRPLNALENRRKSARRILLI